MEGNQTRTKRGLTTPVTTRVLVVLVLMGGVHGAWAQSGGGGGGGGGHSSGGGSSSSTSHYYFGGSCNAVCTWISVALLSVVGLVVLVLAVVGLCVGPLVFRARRRRLFPELQRAVYADLTYHITEDPALLEGTFGKFADANKFRAAPVVAPATRQQGNLCLTVHCKVRTQDDGSSALSDLLMRETVLNLTLHPPAAFGGQWQLSSSTIEAADISTSTFAIIDARLLRMQCSTDGTLQTFVCTFTKRYTDARIGVYDVQYQVCIFRKASGQLQVIGRWCIWRNLHHGTVVGIAVEQVVRPLDTYSPPSVKAPQADGGGPLVDKTDVQFQIV